MKKAEKKLESARKAATRERGRSKLLTYVAAGAPMVAAVVAPTVLPMLPGPTSKDIEEMVAKKQGAFRSKRVLIPGAVTLGLVLFGGNSIMARAAAAVSGGLTATAYSATRAKMTSSEVDTLAVEAPKK